MSFKIIGLLGDSIAAGYWDARGIGWFGRIKEKLSKKFPNTLGFVSFADTGDTTVDCKNKLIHEVIDREPDILIIASGVNDIIRPYKKDNPQNISESEREVIWYDLLRLAKKHVTKNILVIGLKPTSESAFNMPGVKDTPLYNTNLDIEEYNHLISKVCLHHNVEFLDLFYEWKNLDLNELLEDGDHPNEKGHDLLGEQIFKKLISLKWI